MPCTACSAIVSFVEMYFNVTEPGIVEVGVELTGNIPSNGTVTVMVRVNSATATGTCSY